MEEPEKSASKVERTPSTNEVVLFMFILTGNMNAKGQTWNESIWTVIRSKEKSPS